MKNTLLSVYGHIFLSEKNYMDDLHMDAEGNLYGKSKVDSYVYSVCKNGIELGVISRKKRIPAKFIETSNLVRVDGEGEQRENLCLFSRVSKIRIIKNN